MKRCIQKKIATPDDVDAVEAQRRQDQFSSLKLIHTDENEEQAQMVSKETGKVGRNDLCPCGSNKKYKACHGRLV